MSEFFLDVFYVFYVFLLVRISKQFRWPYFRVLVGLRPSESVLVGVSLNSVLL